MKYQSKKDIEVEDVGTVTICKLTRADALALDAIAAMPRSTPDEVKASDEASSKVDDRIIAERVLAWPDGPPDKPSDLTHGAYREILFSILEFSGIETSRQRAAEKPGPLPETSSDGSTSG